MNLAKKEGSHESTDAQSPWSDALLRDAGFGPSVAADRSGGGTDAGVFEAVAHVLVHDYTVVTYDPRGNSRSPLDGPPTDQQIAVHSDDARRLLSTTASDPAAVFGSSSGRDKVTKLSPPPSLQPVRREFFLSCTSSNMMDAQPIERENLQKEVFCSRGTDHIRQASYCEVSRPRGFIMNCVRTLHYAVFY